MTILAFSGMDCAGKSTQIRLLRDALESRGLRVVVHWYRPGYSPELDRLRAWVRRSRPGTLPAAGRSEARRRTFSKPSVRLAWAGVALLDMMIQYSIHLRSLAAKHDVVLCDRTLLDARIDFALRFPELAWLWKRGASIARAAMPRVDAHFLLTLTLDEIVRRQEKKREPFPDPPALRDARYALYSKASDAIRIDSSFGVERVRDEIWGHLTAQGLVDGSS